MCGVNDFDWFNSGFDCFEIFGKMDLVKAAVVGFVLESMAMGLILVLVSPFSTAVHIVDTIYFSMIAANTIGFVLWVYLANMFKQRQK
jgi:LytS/YehU family sensor histidine kinase